MPARAAATASAAVTVVFPTPPLPATMTTWEVEQNCATSIPACYERPMRSPHVRRPRRCRGRPGARGGRLLAAVVACGRRDRRPPRGHAAAAPRDSGRTGIVVVQVNGLIDPSNAALITKSLRDAATRARLAASCSSSTLRARSTSTRRRSCSAIATRRCRSRCGSARRAVKRAARARCSRSRPRRTCRSRPARTSARSCRVDFDHPDAGLGAPPRPQVATLERGPRPGATTPPRSSTIGSRAATALRRQADRRHRPDARPVHRRARTVRSAHRDRRRAHVDVEDRRRRLATARCRPTRW